MQSAQSKSFQNNSKKFTEDGFKAEFGTEIEGAQIDSSAVLKQDFSFSKSDLSMLLDKFINGDVRIIVNNDGAPFERITTVNNYPGLGDRSQGTVTNAVALHGEDNFPTPVDGFIQSLGQDGNPFPNSRQVSNSLSDQGDAFMPEEAGYNNLFMGVGQYIDHGLDSIPKQAGEDADKMTIFLPTQDPLRNNSFDFNGQPVTQLNLLNAADPIEGTEGVGDGEFQNSKTPFFDQDQSYGATPQVAGLLREKDQWGENTARLVDSSWSSSSDLKFFKQYGQSVVGMPTIYDVFINSAHELGYSSQQELKEVLDGFLSNNELRIADKVVREWDQKVRSQEFSETITGNPIADKITVRVEGEDIEFSVIEQLGILQGQRAMAFAQLNARSSNGTDFEEVFGLLVGDASPLAKYSLFSVVSHFASADNRTSENLQLIALSEVFQKNHNHLVSLIEDQLAKIASQFDSLEEVQREAPGLEHVVALAKGWGVTQTDEQGQTLMLDHQEAVFAMARTINNAAYQRMIFDQYIVHATGGIHFGISSSQDKELMPDTDRLLPQDINMNEHGFNGVHPEVNPHVSTEFAGAAFRYGHSQIYKELNGSKSEVVDEVIRIKKVIDQSLIEAFVNPTLYDKTGGAAGIIAANAYERSQAVDELVVDEVRNMLIGQPNDLLAFNVERGIEMGLPTLQEFRESIYNLFQETGIGNSLQSAASDVSAGVFEHGSEHNEFLSRIKPYENWRDFSKNLRDSDLVYDFMALYGGAEATLDNSVGLNNVSLYVGGLAEKQVKTPNGEGLSDSLLGSTFSFILIDTFDRAQDVDEEYYKISIPGSDILKQLGHQTWTAMIQTALEDQAQFLHQDTFRVARIDTIEDGIRKFTATNEHDWDGNAFNRVITGNAQNNVIRGSSGDAAEGFETRRASDDIRGGAGDDRINALGGEDWVYGQDGEDTLRGGSDHDIDHLFGGNGDDTLYGEDHDALFGENDNDVLIRLDGTGFHDGGLGDDIILAGDSIDVVSGDSGAEDSENVEGSDILFGGKGSDEVAGRGGDDIVVGDGSGSDSKIGDRLYGDAVAPTHNAELLARAWESRNKRGKIVDTIVPLKSELGYGVLVGGINPLTGDKFTSEQIDAFREYIEGLRKVKDPNDPGERGPRPTMVVMPYSGPAGDDHIYTGKHSDIEGLLEGRVDSEHLTSWMERNDYIEGAESAVPEAEAEFSSADLVFADRGDDNIYTDGSNSTYVFGGEGYDTLFSGRESSDTSAEISVDLSSLNAWGAEGTIASGSSGITDHFFGMERIVLDHSKYQLHGSNSLIFSGSDAPLTVSYSASRRGNHTFLSSADTDDMALDVSFVNHFELSRQAGNDDTILQLEKAISDHFITWDGQTLSVDWRSRGTTTFQGIDQVVFSQGDEEQSIQLTQVELDASGFFDLGTALGDGDVTNLIRAGSTITQTNTWTNIGESGARELSLESFSNDVAEVTAVFENGETYLNLLRKESSIDVSTTFKVSNEAVGQILSTSGDDGVGFELQDKSWHRWDTRDSSAFQVDHLVTYQGDLNLDGNVDDTDLQLLSDSVNSGDNLSMVDANYDGIIDYNDFEIVKRDQIISQQLGEDAFSGVLSGQDPNVDFLFVQGERTWDSTAFTDQLGIDRSTLIANGLFSLSTTDDPSVLASNNAVDTI